MDSGTPRLCLEAAASHGKKLEELGIGPWGYPCQFWNGRDRSPVLSRNKEMMSLSLNELPGEG